MTTTLCGFNDGPSGTGSNLLVAFGPTLAVLIGFDPTYDPANPNRPVLPQPPVHALVDSGAFASCIDSGLAMQLNLPIVDRQAISGVGGRHEVNMHLAHVHIPSLNFTIYGPFAGVNLIAGGQAHHALIGRTFLQNFTMIYEGHTGSVKLGNDQAPGLSPEQLEAHAIRCAKGNNGGEWATHYTEEQKNYWRGFVRQIAADLGADIK
jgi:hypothetical protein